jgi:hypothetical protein
LTTPARKPRTECCCQPVAFVISATVVPLGWRSMPRTVSCFVDGRLVVRGGFASVRGRGSDGAAFPGARVIVDGFLLREVVAERFAGFAFLRVAIGPSWCLTTASSAATDTSPHLWRARGRALGFKRAGYRGNTRSFRRRCRADCRDLRAFSEEKTPICGLSEGVSA